MEDVSFEEAFKKLESIVQRLEMGDLSLDDSLKLYEEGMRYSRICLKILEDAKKKIEIVKIDGNGDFSIEEIDPEEFLKNG